MLKNNQKIIFIIFLTAFLTYSFSLGNQFLWDDEEQIVANKIIQNWRNLPSLWLSGIVYTHGQTLGGGFYRPILNSAYLFLYLLGQGQPFVFRFFQVFVHALNSILVYLFFTVLFKNQKTVLFLSLIFAVHPAISEGVLFTAGLAEPLYFFFTIGSFFLFLKKKIPLSLLLFFLALLTKEAALVLFPLLIFYLWFSPEQKRDFISLFPYSVIIFLYFFARITIVGGLVNNLHFPSLISQQPLPLRLINLPYEIAFYLLNFIFPFKLAISNQTVVNQIQFNFFWRPFFLILIFIFSVFFLFKKTKNKLFLFFLFWFLLSLLPVLNLVPLSATVADRWFYLPIIGLLGILGLTIFQPSWLKFKLINLFGLVLISFLAVGTFRRSLDWRNGFTLYQHDLTINPTSFELQNNYGVELFRRGQLTQAKEMFQKSVETNPHWWTNLNNLGVMYEKEGNWEKAAELYQQAINNGHYFLAYQNLAQLYLNTQNYQKANELLTKAVKIFPGEPSLYRFFAISLYQSNQKELALKQAQLLWQLEPTEQNFQLWQAIANQTKLPANQFKAADETSGESPANED